MHCVTISTRKNQAHRRVWNSPTARIVFKRQRFLRNGAIDNEILDINLHGAKTYPLADRLIAQGRKFLFITGYGADAVDPAYHAYPRYEKPCKAVSLVAALSLLKEKRPS